MSTDEELMEAYVAGDRAAFRELFRRYAPVVMRLVSRGLGPDEARDLVQQTFLLLHRARHDFRAGSGLRPWLCTIAINARRQFLRDTLRHRALDGALSSASPGLHEREAVTCEVPERVHAALAGLPAEQREVIVLHWMQGLSFAEVARVVGASLSAVKVRAHRGYRGMRRSLQPGDEAPP
ncbi:MAG TPA: sigma-70 family RNA polymerase sigma factor [Polyangiales bacterium]